MLLLAGQANSHTWWDGLRTDFEDDFHVVTLDQRGTGRSRGPVGDWSTALFADDAADVLDAMGTPTARVYGTSMGGRVAQILAAQYPNRVERLVLACTSPGGRHGHERANDVRRDLSHPDSGRRLGALQRLFFTEQWPFPPEDSHLFGDSSMSSEEKRAHLRVSSRHDAWDRLPRIEAPTLVMHGTDDLMSPVANAHLLADRIPGARLHVVDGGRHGFFEEFRREISPLVSDFCA